MPGIGQSSACKVWHPPSRSFPALSNHILLFGRDAPLLQTRSLILNKEGLAVDAASAPVELLRCLGSRYYRLLVLCHSLATVELEAVTLLACSLQPELRFLALAGASTNTWASETAIPVSRSAHPEALLAAVHAVLGSAKGNEALPERKKMALIEGTVKWFNNAKGYGFLGRADGGPDVFTHFSAIEQEGYKTLKEGDPVTFDIVQGEKGPQAEHVQVHPEKK